MELSLRSLFEKPTVTALAGDVVQRIAERANHDDLASRLAEVEGLSFRIRKHSVFWIPKLSISNLGNQHIGSPLLSARIPMATLSRSVI